jgi:hypothetical protein
MAIHGISSSSARATRRRTSHAVWRSWPPSGGQAMSRSSPSTAARVIPRCWSPPSTGRPSSRSKRTSSASGALSTRERGPRAIRSSSPSGPRLRPPRRLAGPPGRLVRSRRHGRLRVRGPPRPRRAPAHPARRPDAALARRCPEWGLATPPGGFAPTRGAAARCAPICRAARTRSGRGTGCSRATPTWSTPRWPSSTLTPMTRCAPSTDGHAGRPLAGPRASATAGLPGRYAGRRQGAASSSSSGAPRA